MNIKKLPPTRLTRGNPISFTEMAKLVGRDRSHVYRCWIGQSKPGKPLARELKKFGWVAPVKKT